MENEPGSLGSESERPCPIWPFCYHISVLLAAAFYDEDVGLELLAPCVADFSNCRISKSSTGELQRHVSVKLQWAKFIKK